MPTSSQSQQSPETLANAPFDDTRADVILRSSDGVDFRVFKIILSLASPIFADMFSIPQPVPNGSHAEPPVVTLSEDSKTLDFVLRHLYPVEHPKEIELRDACTLIEFARKYQVKVLGHVVARSLTDAIESDPTGVYAIAVTYGEADIAIKAARSSLKRPISHLKPSQLQCATAVLYGELIQYHIACGEAASAVTSQREWFPCEIDGYEWCPVGSPEDRYQYADPMIPICKTCVTQDVIWAQHDTCDLDRFSFEYAMKRYGPRCVWNYLHRSALVLARHPTAEAVATEAFLMVSLDCPNCPSGTRKDMLEFIEIFATEIENAVEGVPLPNSLRPSKSVSPIEVSAQ
ncbi:hypothetical protein BJV78DRAFT_1173189 [Lactifluus subvellereus]|nr:hypothetical protein BJV78DRAFT_1173189 [Lactifluus subvellereus]